MGIRGKLIGLLILMASAPAAYAQFRIPQFDVELKGGITFVDGSDAQDINRADAQHWQAGVHVQINQNFAIGGTYARSFHGEVEYNDNSGSSSTILQAEYLSYGGDFRVSAGRSSKWRPYLMLGFGRVEFVQHNDGYNFAAQTNAMTVNGGVMLRLGSNLYWNVVEGGLKKLSDKIFWLNSSLLIEFKTGLTYNIRIKNK